ncbi:MAG: ATP-binding protein [Candidatus Ratteibacteria bacterium]|jgi:predicted AAA+ superfamily ATPase
MEEILLLLNEWWESGSIAKDKAKEYRRKIFEEIKETYFNYRLILILTGLRRVGKSTILFQLIEELLKKGVNPKNILYFSFDEVVEEPTKILNEYSKITKVDWRKEKVFLFFDEIHKLKDWSSKIKLLYDIFPNLKICVSGSASINIEREAAYNLAGRYFSFEIKPLTLQEFGELYFEKSIGKFELYKSDLSMIFDDYIKRPFPEIVKWKDTNKVNEYIKTLIIEKVIKTDIPEVFGNVNISLLSNLVEMFMKEPGIILNITSLAKDLGVHKLTLSNHIKFLEYGKIIRIVKNYRPSIRIESRKLPKVYPYNIALSFCFYPSLKDSQISESLVASALNANEYWRENRKEIDFLELNKNIVPIEVKEKEKIEQKELKNMIWFMDKHKLDYGVVVYKGKEDSLKLGNKKIRLYPLSKLLFNFKLES